MEVLRAKGATFSCAIVDTSVISDCDCLSLVFFLKPERCGLIVIKENRLVCFLTGFPHKAFLASAISPDFAMEVGGKFYLNCVY